MIELSEIACTDMSAALGREWLETNGLGGFASSTVIGTNTRRYHGLLVAATHPPVGRLVLLSKLEETVIVDGQRYELCTNQYSGAIHPTGFQYLRRFRLDPFPTITFAAGGAEVEKSVFMPQGENTTVVQYRVVEWGKAKEVRLELRPLVAFRNYHSLTRSNPALNPAVNVEDGIASIQPYGSLPTLFFGHDGEVTETIGNWYFNFEYAAERARGLDFIEDLFNPFLLGFRLNKKKSEATVIASLEKHKAADAADLRTSEVARRAALTAKGDNDFIATLKRAADQFIVNRREHMCTIDGGCDCKTVIAGYHWFSDWGRDTMISLPGLTLSTKRFDTAKNILNTFAAHVSEGMLPNRFPDTGETPEYNTVDATLWFFHTIDQYLRATSDTTFVRERLYPVLIDILDWHLRGTRHGIHVDSDGLLLAGEPGVQLTWMDAKIGDWVVTPRHGKPVEIQALWYNALRVAQDLAKQFKDEKREQQFGEVADLAFKSFSDVFWNDAAGCLFDVVSNDGKDASIRPNQIFAISLPNPLIFGDKAKSVMQVVERDLLTPMGLRTLAPSDPNYRRAYEGDVLSRDSAYHQGTVWPWLLGPFVSAFAKVNGVNPKTQGRIGEVIAPMQEHLSQAGLGQISEVFGGDAPHTPGGCIAQAWSIAEILRVVLAMKTPAPSKKSTAPKKKAAKAKATS